MLLGFKKQFIPKIHNGSKIHTVRKRRKVQPKIEESLHMYTALRTIHCELISNKEKLKGVQSFRMIVMGYIIKIWVDRRQLTKKETHEFAINDGFDNLKEFAKYWTNGTGKVGVINHQIFHWTDFKY